MEKSLSVASFTSDQLDDEENEDSEFEYNAAPWDVLGGHESVGTIVVAKKGEKLPLETKYKRRKLTDVAVKLFRMECRADPGEPVMTDSLPTKPKSLKANPGVPVPADSK